MVSLAFFVPILVAMGGNTGTQSATLIIRSLATGDIKVKDFFRVIFRESFMAIFMGVTLALAGSVIVALLQKNLLLSAAVGISMGLTIFFAATLGASVPIIFRKLKLDPALMSGPLIATVVDVVGIFIYFEIGRLILGL